MALEAAVAAGLAARANPDRSVGVAAYMVAKNRLSEWCHEHGVGPGESKLALGTLHARVSGAPSSDPGPAPTSPSAAVTELAATLWSLKVVRLAAAKAPAGAKHTVLALADHLAGMRDSSAKPMVAYTTAIARAASAVAAESSGSTAPPAWRVVAQRIEQYCFHARTPPPALPDFGVTYSAPDYKLEEAYQAGIRGADPSGHWTCPFGFQFSLALAPVFKAAGVTEPCEWLRAKACEFRKAKNTTDDAKYTNNWHPKHFINWLNGASATLVQLQNAKGSVQPIDEEELKKYQDF